MEVNGGNCGVALCCVSKSNAVWFISLKNFWWQEENSQINMEEEIILQQIQLSLVMK